VKRLLVVAFSLALIAVVGACSDSTGPSGRLAGSYALRTINGATPPVTIFQDARERLEILGGAVTLEADGSYSDRTAFRDTFDGVVTEEETINHGRWSLSGNIVTLTDPLDPNYSSSAVLTNNGELIFQNIDAGFATQAVYSK
jgi:hypothetical protein